MPVQITSDIYQLKVPLPTGAGIPDSNLGYTLSYLVEGAKGWLLIDTGWNHDSSLEALLQEIADVGVKTDHISWILGTHYHGDHFGLARKMCQMTGAKLFIHQQDWRLLSLRLASPEQENSFHDTLRKWLLAQGVPPDIADMRFFTPGGANLQIEDRQQLISESRSTLDIGTLQLELIRTPGHSPGHICIYDRTRKILFSGDHLLPTITPNISVTPFDLGEPLGDYLASLDLVEEKQVDLVLPGHERTFTNLHERVVEMKEHHRARLAETLKALQQTPQPAYDVATRITWDVGPWEQTKVWEKRMATLETLAHLERLVAEGKVEKTQKNGAMLYQAVLTHNTAG